MLTLGSLFDGSGGFPLAGAINGITPVWSSEIEAYPLRVTAARFPNVTQLGSVLEINGWEIRPAYIVTFGSPCQDLSVAGKQKGIHEGERSCLFFEAIRIVKEMRDRDRAAGRTGVDIRPRFLVWENVPGAFSSNGGEDFRAVLEAIGGIAQDGVSIPRPPKGKWEHAGCVVGDGWSIAWRIYDAQYWGVPQRRKRIYLVADLASERAGEILFERESLCGDPAEGREARQGIAGDAQGGTGGSCGADVSATGFKANQGPKARSIGYQEEQSPTLTSANSGTNTVPDVVYALQGNGIDRALTAGCNGSGWREQVSYTLNTIDRHGVVHSLDCRNMRGQFEISGTLQAKPNGGQSLNYQNPVIYDTTQITSPKYIVRRLTPLECCRLQGFPDWWEDGVEGSDSARYKMWGNGIALPCAVDVLRRIAKTIKEESP